MNLSRKTITRKGHARSKQARYGEEMRREIREKEQRKRKVKKVHDSFGRVRIAHGRGVLDDLADLLGTGRERLKHGNEEVAVAVAVPRMPVDGHLVFVCACMCNIEQSETGVRMQRE